LAPLPTKKEAGLSPMVAKQAEAAAYDELRDEFFPWSAMKPAILQEYTTD
jgi:hypothetical protein